MFQSNLPLGQLFLFGFEGKALSSDAQRFIREYGLGGIIYFARNIETPEQIRDMSEAAQALAKIPLWISVDQEGGRVRRLQPPHFTDIPTGHEIGKLYFKNPDAARDLMQSMTREMTTIGINLDFAPVLDVHSNPENPIIGDRAFSNDAYAVSEVAKAFIDVFHGNGLLACGKHFPGHGDTDVDSHLDLPVVHHTLARLRALEWVPFRDAIHFGLEMIMTAHILYPEIDPAVPATLSPRFLQDILRRELRFDGIIITDDMGMKGIARDYGLNDASLLALKAGADIILVCEQFDEQEALLHHIDKAIVDGTLPRAQIEAALARIARVKKKLR